jgi:hypothetical protein
MHLIRSRRYDALLQKMSVRLRGDAAFRMCEFRLRSVPFLVHPDLEPEFMCNLAIKYATNVYSRLERVPCTDLFVVERGVVAKHGKLGVAGVCFGKDVILANEALRDIGDAIALTFVQTIALAQKDIFELLPEYPMAYVIVRKAALRMALIRALSKAAAMVTRSKNGMAGSSILDIFDRAMREAHDAKQAMINDENERREAHIPLTLKGSASLDGLKKSLQAARAKRAKLMASQSGGVKKGWGKMRLSVATGETREASFLNRAQTSILAAGQTGSPIDEHWEEKVKKSHGTGSHPGSPSLGSPAGAHGVSSAAGRELEESVRALRAQMVESHRATMEVQSAVLKRISMLEIALTDTVRQVTVKLEEASRLRRSPTGPIVRQKRGATIRNKEALESVSASSQAHTMTRQVTSSFTEPVAAPRLSNRPLPSAADAQAERQEMREALSADNIRSTPMLSHPTDEARSELNA